MADKFLDIVITEPSEVTDEPLKIIGILEAGVDFLHIRKPDWNETRTKGLLIQIPTKYYDRLILHDHYHLAKELGLGGINLNSRNNYNNIGMDYSVSCHSLKELDIYPNARYKFLSPIYNSISKADYLGAYNLTEIKSHINNKKVIALGGVSPKKKDELLQHGFIGGASLGYVWQNYFEYIDYLKNKYK